MYDLYKAFHSYQTAILDYIQLCMLVQYFQDYEAWKGELEDKNENETETETDNSRKKNSENKEKYNGWFPTAHRCCN